MLQANVFAFLFDEDAGKKSKTIDLFASDDDMPPEEPIPEDAEPSDEPDVPDEPLTPEAEEKPKKKADKQSEMPKFRFDRYGRRIGKRTHYGRRKNAQKATTTVVEHETEAKREYDEARKRSEARAKRRAREEEKTAAIKKLQRRKKRRRGLSTLVLGLLALAALAGLTWYTTLLNKVNIKNVPQGYTEERILELSGLTSSVKKKSALFISTRDVEKKIAEDPYLIATVRYAFPSTINIALSKRDEAACVRWGPQNEYLAIIDENGIVLNDRAETANGLLIADGMNVSSAVNGTRLGDSSDIRVAELIRLLTKLKEHGLTDRQPRINRIDMTELMQVRMYVEGAPYTIELGDLKNLETGLNRLEKKWTQIMDEATEFVRKGSTTVTIYPYGKRGVYVSQYEQGYSMPTPEPFTPRPQTSAGPQPTPGAGPEETPGESYEPQPIITPMPHQDEPFTG